MEKRKKMVRIGFIGYGRFAKMRHKILSKYCTQEVEVIGYFDLNQTSDELEYFETSAKLLQNCDAVFIAVPPGLAPMYTLEALKNGINVFCEKPAAVCSDDLNPVQRILKQNHRLIAAYGFNHRRHRSIIKIKELTDQQYFGRLLWMRGRYGKEVGTHYTSSWRSNKMLNGGGILIDQGIHMVDLMSWLAGGFDITSSIMSNSFFGVEKVEDNAFVTLANSASGVSASLHSTITQWRYLFSLELFYEKGSIILNGLRTSSGLYGDERLNIQPNQSYENEFDTITIDYGNNHSWKDEVTSFVESLVTSQHYPYADIHDAVATTALIDKIYKEAKWI